MLKRDSSNLNRHWIPPAPLLFGLLAFVFSWLLLFDVARHGMEPGSFEAFAWIHTVALGWVTTVALAVLIHALLNFVDVTWRGDAVARGSVYIFIAGVVVLVIGFLTANVAALQTGASVACVALLAYICCALATLAQAFKGERLERAVARAFTVTLLFLVAAAILGTVFTFALGGMLNARILATGPPAHAVLGIGGWLTLLVVGVSARTLRPMTGTRSRFPALHIGGSTALLLGILLATVAIAVWWPVAAFTGFVLAALGAVLYFCDVADIVRRSTTPHLAPRMLMLFAAGCCVASAVLAAGAMLGANTGAAAVYLALIGWIGAAVVAHLHHIGVRVMLTFVLSDADETRPWEVLTAQLTWSTAAFYVAAALLGTLGLCFQVATLVETASACGTLASIIMIANVMRAYRTARSRAARWYSLV